MLASASYFVWALFSLIECSKRGSSFSLKAIFLFGAYLFSRNQGFLRLETSAMGSILEWRQLCWVRDAALGGVWAVSYCSGPQCILADSYVAADPLARPDL